MSLQVPGRTDPSPVRKIKKVPKSPEKHVVTGQTETAIHQPAQTIITSTSIENPQTQTVGIPNPLKKINYILPNIDLTYNGYHYNSIPQGEGSLYSFNGQLVFKGYWQNGARNGYGVYYYPDGSTYEGNWVDNRKEGKGKYCNVRGEIYEGGWLGNRREGAGVLRLVDGTVLTGVWRNDQFVSGVMKYPDCSTYDGQSQNYIRTGNGSYTYPDGSRFSGQWQNNMKTGLGQMNYTNGDQFKGPLVENLLHGNCQYIWRSRNREMTSGTFIHNKCQVAAVREI